MGTGEIGIPSLRLLQARTDCEIVGVVTQPDKPAGRSRALKASLVKQVAMDAGIPVFQPISLKKNDAVETISAWAPELIVVMAFGQILPRTVLDMPRVACLNLHASLLPKYRGASPINAAIAAGDKETGICVMYMAEGLDTGDILLEKRERILRRDTAGTLHDRLAHVAASALSLALDQLANGTAPRMPQSSAASYAGRLTRTDGFIDWTLQAHEIEQLIRAMNPWPSAWTTIPMQDGTMREVKLFSAIVCRHVSGTPGHLLRADHRGLLIACGSGALLIKTVQMEGRKRMDAGLWQLGTSIQIGSTAGLPTITH